MKLRIVNPTGQVVLTRIENADTGEPLEGVLSVRWEAAPKPGEPYRGRTRCWLELIGVEVDVVTDAEVVAELP